MIYVMSGGGKTLPFRVFVSTSQPSSPKKFDIWVKTAFAATQIRFINNGMPAATANPGAVMIKYDGTVWWNTDNFTLIDGVKSNGVPVYAHAKLLGCYQAKTISASTGKAPYELIEAYYYGGSSWVQFSSEQQYFYSSNPSNQYTAVTGGWASTARDDSGAFTFAADAMTLTAVAGYSEAVTWYRRAYTVNKISITGNTLEFVTTTPFAALGITSAKSAETYLAKLGNPTAGTKTLDVSAFIGQAVYVQAEINAGSNGGSATGKLVSVRNY